MKRALIAILFCGIVGAYLLSLVGVLFVSGDAWFLGGLAFLATLGSTALVEGPFLAQRPLQLRIFWDVFGPLFGVLVLLCCLLSLRIGAPEIGSEPILAIRERYLFSSGVEAERWRFVVVAVSFHFGWHVFGIGIALDNWLAMVRERVHGDLSLAPPGTTGGFRADLRQLQKLVSGARRGRWSKTHFKRIRKLVYFTFNSKPFVYLVVATVCVLMAAMVVGLLPGRAMSLLVGLVFSAVWLALALDLALSIWTREISRAIWMSLWVVGWGVVTLTVLRHAVSGG